MKEAADQLLLVHLVGGNFHTAHELHLTVKVQQFLLICVSN